MEGELSEKLDRKITLNFDRLMAADLSGRARAFQSDGRRGHGRDQGGGPCRSDGS